jgi:hypothetical protein
MERGTTYAAHALDGGIPSLLNVGRHWRAHAPGVAALTSEVIRQEIF